MAGMQASHKTCASLLCLLSLLVALQHGRGDFPKHWDATDEEIRRGVPDWSGCSTAKLAEPGPGVNRSWLLLGGLMGGDEWLIEPKHRDFEADIPGVGNYLIFFPAMYWFAVFTGRTLVIGDGIMSEFCRHVGCCSSFSNRSTLIERGLYNKSAALQPLNVFDLTKHFEDTSLRHVHYLRGAATTPASEWWMYFPFLGKCVSRLSKCSPGDVSCAERFAFQQLIKGPFQHFSSSEEHNLRGMPASLLHKIRTLPHATAPRFSAAFHIRREFMHFENASDPQNDPFYRKSVYAWSNSSEADFVYSQLAQRFIDDFPLYEKKSGEDVYVYICGDNNHVKNVLADRIKLAVAANLTAQTNRVHVMFIDDPLIHHSRNRLVMREGKPYKHPLVNIAFDWYCMSLANYIYAWRNKGTRGSTFVGTAGRVSGNSSAQFSAKFQLSRARRGPPKYSWDKEWGYSILEDYLNLTIRRL